MIKMVNGKPVEMSPEEESKWVESLKESDQEKAAKKRLKALHALKETDWYVLRLAETGKPIPSNISTLRQTAREEANLL